jgi:phosphoribosyl 1,2-cyclic phosphodiesterase
MFKMFRHNIDSMSIFKNPVSDSHNIPTTAGRLLVRINGTLPDLSTLGDEKKSERAAEVKQKEIIANTSCSIFDISSTTQPNKEGEIFHLLIDAGEGVVKSIEKGISDSVSVQRLDMSLSKMPNAVLITHSHDDHINDLSKLIDKVKDGSGKIDLYCTNECREQIINKFPGLAGKQSLVLNVIQPDDSFKVGPFSVTPVLANHGDNSPSGSVIYIVNYQDKKIVMGWDFLSLPNVDENLLWNPDLLVLGTQSYNPHPETGMISVSEAYLLVRRWNVKECYLVHYSGLRDFEESKNQWFRGPIKAMTTVELQKNVDSHLRISGDSGRLKITVAKEGTIWVPKEHSYDENIPIGNVIEMEGLEPYVCKIEKQNKEDKLKLEIEDRINRYILRFDRPRRDKNNDQLIHGAGETGMLARGPELKMELVTPSSHGEGSAALKISAFKGKKHVFHDDILISDMDAQRLKKYFQENFVISLK